MKWVFEKFMGKKLRKQTERRLDELRHAPIIAARNNGHRLILGLANEPGPYVVLGQTPWGEMVKIPANEILSGHALITGSTGSGKTVTGMLILQALIEMLPYQDIGFGVMDPAKSDLYIGTLWLLANRLDFLEQNDPPAATELRRKIVIIDFGISDPVSPYNILARIPGTEMSYLAASRAELLLDLLPGNDQLSLTGVGLLEKLVLLLSELDLPVIPYLSMALADERFRRKLVSACPNRTVSEYFTKHFATISTGTIAALSRRIAALFSSEGVRLALSGLSAPDFRMLQDDGYIVLINLFGPGVPRSMRHLLQCLLVSDIGHSVFRRTRKSSQFSWFLDESQTLFAASSLRDCLSDLQAMARSFGSHFLFITQSVGAAVRDQRLLRNLFTNLKWSLSFRGEPLDSAFLKSALPVTGRRVRPKGDPFTETSYYSIAEERDILLAEVASLPNRTGYLYFRTRSAEALKLATRDLLLPADLEAAAATFRNDPGIGSRYSRSEYQKLIAERDSRWLAEGSDPSGFAEKLELAYRLGRGPSFDDLS